MGLLVRLVTISLRGSVISPVSGHSVESLTVFYLSRSELGMKVTVPSSAASPARPRPRLGMADRDRALTQRHQGLRGRGPGCQAVRSPFNAVTHMPGVVIASLSRIQVLFVVRSTTVAA